MADHCHVDAGDRRHSGGAQPHRSVHPLLQLCSSSGDRGFRPLGRRRRWAALQTGSGPATAARPWAHAGISDPRPTPISMPAALVAGRALRVPPGGPSAHPSLDRRQPEGRRLSGADGSTGAHGQRAGSRGRRVRACRSHLRRQRCGSRCPWRRLSGHPAIAARRAAAPDHRLVNNHSPARRHGRAGRMREAYRAAWRFFTRRG
jgi:hypothetical protein